MIALTDLREIKSLMDLSLDDTSEDKKLLFLINLASGWIEELLGRQLLLKVRTEYYSGTGTMYLTLRSRPVHPLAGQDNEIRAYVDSAGYYGSSDDSFPETTRLYYGQDFALEIDQDDGTSRSGILVRIHNAGGHSTGGRSGVWQKPVYRMTGMLSPYRDRAFGNIKVIYAAGYTMDSLPAGLRLGINTLVMRLAYFIPLGMELSGESYEERSIGIALSRKSYLLNSVWNMISPYRNWKW